MPSNTDRFHLLNAISRTAIFLDAYLTDSQLKQPKIVPLQYVRRPATNGENVHCNTLKNSALQPSSL